MLRDAFALHRNSPFSSAGPRVIRQAVLFLAILLMLQISACKSGSSGQALVANVSGYSALLKSTSPGGYWTCGDASGDLTDSSGNGNTATKDGAITYGVAGPIPDDATTAISIEGGNENYFAVPSSASLPSGDTLSFVAWIKCGTLSSSSSYGLFYQTGSGSGHPGASVRLVAPGTNVIQFWASDGTTHTLLAQGSTPISDTTTWHLIVATKSGATSKIYLDGVDITSAGSDVTLAPSTAALLIGQSLDGHDFNGSLGQIAIYTSALTPSQVLDLYNHVQRRASR